MNFLKELTHFFHIAGNMGLTSSEQLLWYTLIQLCNSYGKPKQFSVSLATLRHNTGLSQSTIILARDGLVERGFIRFATSENGQASFYEIISLSEKLYDCNENEIPMRDCVSEVSSETVVGKDVGKDVGKVSYINIKQNKEKQNSNTAAVLADMLEEFTQDTDLKNALSDFCRFRRKSLSGFTPASFRLFLNELKSYGDEKAMTGAVQRSLVNGWKSLPPKTAPPEKTHSGRHTAFTNFPQRGDYDYESIEKRAFL